MKGVAHVTNGLMRHMRFADYWVHAQMQLPSSTGQLQIGPFKVPAE
jgi:hypothetical protein